MTLKCTQKHIQYVFNREDFTFHVGGGAWHSKT